MGSTFHLEIVSIEGSLYSGDVHFVVLPGEAGELGVYAHHAPLVTRIRPGIVRIETEDTSEPRDILVAGGILEILPDAVTVLADHAIRSAELDAEKAEQASLMDDAAVRGLRPAFDYAQASHAIRDDMARFFTIALAAELRRNK